MAQTLRGAGLGQSWSLPRLGSWNANTAFALLAGIAAASWLPLVWWYSLPANQANTHFAFEKIPGRFASPILPATLLLFLALAAVYAAGYVLLARLPAISSPVKLALVALVGVPAIANLFIYPVGALDVFNYMIELKLAFAYDRNPYLTTFLAYRDDPFALPAFLVNVPLFYGPVWLLASALPVAIAGFGSVVGLLVALKLFNLVLLAATGYAIYTYRAREDDRSGLRGAYLFLANPLVLFEGIANAHNDVLMTALLVAALVTLNRRSLAAPALLALSALVKLFTLALAPLVLALMWRDRWGWRRLAAAGAVALVVVVLAFTPYWADGAMVNGFRRGIAKSQEMSHVSILSLTEQAVTMPPLAGWVTHLFPGNSSTASRSRVSDAGPFALGVSSWIPRSVASARKTLVTRICALLFVVLALAVAWSVSRGRAWEAGAVDTLLLFTLLMTNLFPWYLIPIVAIVALWQHRRALVYLFVATALGLAYYPAYVFARFDAGWSDFGRHLFLALFLTVPILVYLASEVISRDDPRSLAPRFDITRVSRS